MDLFVTRLVKEWCGRQESAARDRWDIYEFCRIVKTAIGRGIGREETGTAFKEALTEVRAERGWSDEEFSDFMAQIDSSVRLIYVFVSAFPYGEDSDDDPFPYPH
jgi:hypothetical protein